MGFVISSSTSGIYKQDFHLVSATASDPYSCGQMNTRPTVASAKAKEKANSYLCLWFA
jgi:hypothetical protein